MRENQKREGELVSLTEELQNELTRSEEKMEQMVRSHGIWIQRCEEARQAEDAARQAENPFKKGHRKNLSSRDAGDMRTKEVARNVWRASQSRCKRAENLEGALQYILQAMKFWEWAKENQAYGRRDVEKERRGIAFCFRTTPSLALG